MQFQRHFALLAIYYEYIYFEERTRTTDRRSIRGSVYWLRYERFAPRRCIRHNCEIRVEIVGYGYALVLVTIVKDINWMAAGRCIDIAAV